MAKVVFQKKPWWQRLDAAVPFNGSLLIAVLFGLLLGAAFFSGSLIQVLTVTLVPLVLHAVIKNTMLVFLIWIGSTPILSNFVRINLGAGIPDITFDRIAALLLIMVLLFQVAIKLRNLTRFHAVEWMMVALFLMMMPAIVRAYNPIQAAQQVFDHIWTPMIVFFLAKNLLTSKQDIRPLIWTLGIVTLYCAVLGFQEHYTEYSFFTASGKLNWQQEGMADRIQGPFSSPQILGTVMMGGVVFFFYLMFTAERMWARLFAMAILLIHSMVTYWTYRRSVWMGYFVTLAFLGIVEKRFRKPLMVLIGISIVMMALNWNRIYESSVFQQRLANSHTVNDRYVVWMTAWEIAKEFPLFGTGLGWFGHYYDKYFTFFGNTVTTDFAHDITSAHNSYIRLWVEGGPIVLIPYLGVMVMFVHRVIKLLTGQLIHRMIGKMEVMVFVGVFITQYVQALTTDQVFHAEYGAILIFLLGGVLFQECDRPLKPGPGADLGSVPKLKSAIGQGEP
jgi:O-antigen ligase